MSASNHNSSSHNPLSSKQLFEQFYVSERASFLGRIWEKVCKYLKDKEDKIEVYQFAMAILWVHLQTGFMPDNLKAYFYGIVKKYLLNWCRKKAREHNHLDYLKELDTGKWADDDEMKLIKKDWVEQAMAILQKENPRYALLLELRYLNDLDFEEIQAFLQKQEGKETSIHAIQASLYLARKKFKEIIPLCTSL